MGQGAEGVGKKKGLMGKNSFEFWVEGRNRQD
jgi:hypothetical protein